MEHSASTEHGVPWGTVLRASLILVAAMGCEGCETSNAVIMGAPVGGAGTASNSQMAPKPTTPRLATSNDAGRDERSSQPSTPIGRQGSAGLAADKAAMPAGAAATAGAGSAAPTMTSSAAAGAAQTEMPVKPSAPTEGTPPEQGCRASQYSLAVRLTLDASWQETIGILAGSDKAYVWSKLTLDPTTNMVSEFRMCGTLLPVFHTSAVAGNKMAFQRVPQASFDVDSMPKVMGGSVTRTDSSLELHAGILVTGLMLPDPAGPWPGSPTAPNVVPVDADSDGKPGMTSLMRNNDVFTGSPTSILQSARIDASYVASRLTFQVTLDDDDDACADTLAGTAQSVAFDSLMLGCHVKDGADCLAEELQFITDARPIMSFGAEAVADAVVIPVDATCAQAVAVLDVPSP